MKSTSTLFAAVSPSLIPDMSYAGSYDIAVCAFQGLMRTTLKITLFTTFLNGFISLCAFASNVAPENIIGASLFRHQTYNFDSSNHGECANDTSESPSIAEVERSIFHYESAEIGVASAAVRLLTDHTNPDINRKIDKDREVCSGAMNVDHCVLARYWGDLELSERVFALFYDTGLTLRRSNVSFAAFSVDQIRVIERAMRKIPIHLSERMALGHPSHSEYFPPEKVLVRDHVPFTIDAENNSGMGGELGLVITGTNLISFNIGALDKAKAGKAYRDVGYRFLGDFRIQFILHEIGHVVDSFFLDNENSTSSVDWKVLSRSASAVPLRRFGQAHRRCMNG